MNDSRSPRTSTRTEFPFQGTSVDSRLLAPASNNATAPSEVAQQIVKVVDTLKDSRLFRVFVGPADDGAEDVFRVGDRVRQWF